MTEKKIPITNDNRCHYMMNPGGIVWESMNALATAFRQKETQYIHFIQYDDLVLNPRLVMQNLHGYLRLDSFNYDFNNIIQKDREKDVEVYGLPTMHEVRKSINKISKPYQEVLSTDVINKYINYDFGISNKCQKLGSTIYQMRIIQVKPTISGITTYSGRHFFVPPQGDTASRPSDCEAGSLRFNTDSAKLEYFRGNTIGWTEIEAELTEPLGGGTGSNIGLGTRGLVGRSSCL